MEYYIDTKLTIWERMEFESEEQMLEAKKLLESGELITGLQISNHFGLTSEMLFDTQEEIFVEENNGCATLEILNKEGDTIWHNGTHIGYQN